MSLLFAFGLFALDGDVGRKVQELLRAHQADVFGCVQKAEQPPEGELLVRLVAGEGGRVAQAEVLKDESKGGPVGGCIVDKMRGWDLTPLGVEPGDQVVFPLAFKPDKPRKPSKAKKE